MNSKIIALSLCVFALETQLIQAEERIEQERMEQERIEVERIAPERMQQEHKGFNPNAEEQGRAVRFEPRLSAESSLQCPNLVLWDQRSPIDGWDFHIHHNMMTLKPKWYAYDAWILIQPKDFPEWKVQCNYVAYSAEGEKIGKVTFGRTLENPEAYQFKGPNYQVASKTGQKCAPWEEGLRNVGGLFPPDCEIVLKKVGSFNNENLGRK